MHWLFWTGLSFVVASLVSMAIVLSGEAPPRQIEELFGYSVGWLGMGIVLLVFGLLKNLRERFRKKN